ncbi:TatD family hydrolase [Paenibacillus radicis (ex Gao et al. 2016)]|uniref:Hydrolase TatD n=1 Tax=Paenibacillus radicis (ex Gao et al. 2016) TaxID=1737354 RepID=A0A917HQQ8_9BACL|nr:TatD family hydrolase [Paenibacillus radicis (ex Gao et al. 2016)]GGG87383.1 hydrolase TatD [Paenibacillus radicis (ex Gao et al. 2016)]
MISLFDTHTHMDSSKFDSDRAEAINRAREAGVDLMINVGFNRETIPTTMALAEQYDFVYAAVGWHPVDSIEMQPGDLEWIEELCSHPKVVAIGEIGLDYHWDTSPKDVQHRVFREQIRLARKVGKPIIIHNRDAHEDIVRLLKEENAAEVGGVMHCFSGSWETAQKCLDMNFYISFGGPVTFKNARVPKEVLERVPLDRLLIETDSPYLSPHPFRGKRNETAFVTYVAEAAAEITGKTVDEIAKITMENGKKCFGIV